MQQIIAANWKMFKSSSEAHSMILELSDKLNGTNLKNREVIIFPPFTALDASFNAAKEIEGLCIGAQDIFPAQEGAYTGEISPQMVKNCGATWTLTGHSERRHIIGESDTLISKKTSFALASDLNVIVCIGETLEQREAGELYNVLATQLQSALVKLPTPLTPECIVIAYEPVWAIGTGKTASMQDIIEAHAIIREHLKNIIGVPVFETRIIYGGSVKPENAAQILSLDNVDGLLVGGASLDADSFAKIILA